jgi:hypothetical protein
VQPELYSRIFSFGYFHGVRLSFADVSEPSCQVHLQRLDKEFADVSEPSVRSIFKGLMKYILLVPRSKNRVNIPLLSLRVFVACEMVKPTYYILT